MKWMLIEKFIPSDEKFILNAIHGVGDNIKYTPTVDFLKAAYLKLNNMFFNGELPNDIDFKIEKNLDDNGSGHTQANDNYEENCIDIEYVSLNGTMMKTPHSWIETIIHEMIHVAEFTEHPEHFMHKSNYEKHGKWFMDKAKSFKKFGFDIGEIEMDKNIGTSEDDEDIKARYENFMFIGLGRNPVFGTEILVKVAKTDKDKALQALKQKGCKSVKILNTNNLNSTRLSSQSIQDILQRKTLELDDTEFNSKYGPFDEVEKIDLTSLKVNESMVLEKAHCPAITVTILPDGRRRFRT